MNPKAATRTARASIFDGLSGIARQLDGLLARAQTPGTPEHSELSVRRSMRLAQEITRKAMALRSIRDPEPWITAPTRQREDKGQGVAQREVVTVNGGATGIAHRWVWPVKSMQQRWLINPAQASAAERLRRAFDDMRFQPATSGYGEERGARSGFITPRNEIRVDRQIELNAEHGDNRRITLAGEEYGFICARLEDDLKAIAWVLILEQALPGEDAALSLVEFGRRLGKMRSEDHARWYALGALKVTLVRLASIYRQWDVQRKASAAPRERVAAG